MFNDNKYMNTVNLYADGAATPNPGKGGYGVILVYGESRREMSKAFKITTNNRMELLGVIDGLKALKRPSKVIIYTDSQYVVNGISKGWAAKWKENNWYKNKSEKAENFDLWSQLLELCLFHETTFNWVKGHNGHPENERCDELAGIAMDSILLEQDSGYVPKGGHAAHNEAAATNTTPRGNKVAKEGDPCRGCGSSVVKTTPVRKKRKEGQEFYYAYYFHCRNCKKNFYTDDAKCFLNENAGYC